MKKIFLTIENGKYIEPYSNIKKVFEALNENIPISYDALVYNLRTKGSYEYTYEKKYSEGTKTFKVIKKIVK